MPSSLATWETVRRPSSRIARTSLGMAIGWCAFRYSGVPAVSSDDLDHAAAPAPASVATRGRSAAGSRNRQKDQAWGRPCARRGPTILPPMSLDEALETTKVYRAPHHTVSAAALVGGGAAAAAGRDLAGASRRAVPRRA